MYDEITIVAGGWSVRDLNLKRLPGYVIGVNDSAVRLPKCHVALSMDRLWTEARAPVLRDWRHPAYLRRSAMKNVEPWAEVTPFECDYKTGAMSDEPGTLNGGNSGICALNLAYQMRPRRVFLCGFDHNRDAQGNPYWYESYSWAPAGGATSNRRYEEWAELYDVAKTYFDRAGVEVFNVSRTSAIRTFQKITPSDLAVFASEQPR